jgi:hypothetical protein
VRSDLALDSFSSVLKKCLDNGPSLPDDLQVHLCRTGDFFQCFNDRWHSCRFGCKEIQVFAAAML